MDSGFARFKIILADDHPVVRRGLRHILEDTGLYEVCGEACDGNQTLDLARLFHPDVLITDISMPPPNGLEVARRLRETLPEVRVLMLTMHDSSEILAAAAEAGALGYVLKSDAEELLRLALGFLMKGRAFVSPAFDRQLAQELFGAA